MMHRTGIACWNHFYREFVKLTRHFICQVLGAVEAGGQGGLGLPNLEDLEKKTERDNLLIVSPPDFWTFRCPWYLLRLKPSEGYYIIRKF